MENKEKFKAVADAARRLQALVEDPQPGLITWNLMYSDVSAELVGLLDRTATTKATERTMGMIVDWIEKGEDYHCSVCDVHTSLAVILHSPPEDHEPYPGDYSLVWMGRHEEYGSLGELMEIVETRISSQLKEFLGG